jgi:hypothetical protein
VEKVFQANGTRKQKVATFISNKVGFKPKLVRRDEEYLFILIKGTRYQYEITIVNIYIIIIIASNKILLDLKAQITPTQ